MEALGIILKHNEDPNVQYQHQQKHFIHSFIYSLTHSFFVGLSVPSSSECSAGLLATVFYFNAHLQL